MYLTDQQVLELDLIQVTIVGDVPIEDRIELEIHCSMMFANAAESRRLAALPVEVRETYVRLKFNEIVGEENEMPVPLQGVQFANDFWESRGVDQNAELLGLIVEVKRAVLHSGRRFRNTGELERFIRALLPRDEMTAEEELVRDAVTLMTLLAILPISETHRGELAQDLMLEIEHDILPQLTGLVPVETMPQIKKMARDFELPEVRTVLESAGVSNQIIERAYEYFLEAFRSRVRFFLRECAILRAAGMEKEAVEVAI